MGEHGTWFDYLNRFEWWRHLDHWAKSKLERHALLGMFDTGWTLTHVLVALLVLAFCVWGALAFFRGTQTADKGLVPPRTVTLRNFFEYTAESVYGMVEGAMGEKNAARFFPLIGALWIFILFSNLIGLIPGFIAPTDTLKTNVGIAVLVFLLTHYYGVKEHGLAYFKHFLGPSPALAPLMLPKMIGLMGAVAIAVVFLPINIIAFTIGYSIFIVSIIVEATYTALRTPDTEPPAPNEHHHG